MQHRGLGGQRQRNDTFRPCVHVAVLDRLGLALVACVARLAVAGTSHARLGKPLHDRHMRCLGQATTYMRFWCAVASHVLACASMITHPLLLAHFLLGALFRIGHIVGTSGEACLAIRGWLCVP